MGAFLLLDGYFGLLFLFSYSSFPYEEKIIFYATHPKEFKELKEKLADKKKTSSFFDSKLYAENFEKMCCQMIEIYQKENHPQK